MAPKESLKIYLAVNLVHASWSQAQSLKKKKQTNKQTNNDSNISYHNSLI